MQTWLLLGRVDAGEPAGVRNKKLRWKMRGRSRARMEMFILGCYGLRSVSDTPGDAPVLVG